MIRFITILLIPVFAFAADFPYSWGLVKMGDNRKTVIQTVKDNQCQMIKMKPGNENKVSFFDSRPAGFIHTVEFSKKNEVSRIELMTRIDNKDEFYADFSETLKKDYGVPALVSSFFQVWKKGQAYLAFAVYDEGRSGSVYPVMKIIMCNGKTFCPDILKLAEKLKGMCLQPDGEYKECQGASVKKILE